LKDGMTHVRQPPKSVDAYIAGFPADVQLVLQRIRRTIRAEAPRAEEVISYGIPMFRFGGPLVYFAAFKKHIGFYPPVVGSTSLLKQAAPYKGPKGNLKFPLDEPMPYELIRRLVRARLRAVGGKTAASSGL
jgi:uncharacterized protein YdhG (YjbR/CyaY superfamily)